MKVKLLLAAAAFVLMTRPVVAEVWSCQQYLAYRSGDSRERGQGFVFTSFLQGYIDAANEFAELFNGYLISEVSPGKFGPAPPTRPITLENTIALLDRECAKAPSQNANAVGIAEVQARMKQRAAPIVDSMTTVLRHLNDARGYK
jgi:hypothetical protein